MAKAPVAGSAKTRLARQIGVAQATRFARQAGGALLGRVAFDARWSTVIAVAPDAARTSRFWPRGIGRIPQRSGDLGQRMQRVMNRLPPGPVVIIGTDVPAIRAAHVAAAFRALGKCDAVFGPATDGGYWLVGLRRRPSVLQCFGNVRWSTAHALADTLANLGGCSVEMLPILADVDDASAFAAEAGRFGRRVPISS